MFNYKTGNTIVVILSSALFFSWVVFRIIFPVFHFECGQRKQNDNLLVREINHKTYLQVKLKGGYSFNRVVLKSEEDDIELGDVYQDELSLYEDDRQISSWDDLQNLLILNGVNVYNGQLISHGDSVFFIENGKYRTFADAETFDRLGFDWRKVVKVNNGVLHDLEKGEDITHTTIYLNDLFVKINNNLYFLNDGARIKIDANRLGKFIEENFSVVDVDEKRLNSALVGVMICRQTFSGRECVLRRNGAFVFPRVEILIELKKGNVLLNNKLSIRVDTFDGIDSLVPKITLRNIKRLINIRYESEVNKLKNFLK